MRRLAGIPGLFIEAVQAVGEGIVAGLQDHGDPIDRHAEQAMHVCNPGNGSPIQDAAALHQSGTWEQGRVSPRHVYEGHRMVGLFATEDDAEAACAAVNEVRAGLCGEFDVLHEQLAGMTERAEHAEQKFELADEWRKSLQAEVAEHEAAFDFAEYRVPAAKIRELAGHFDQRTAAMRRGDHGADFTNPAVAMEEAARAVWALLPETSAGGEAAVGGEARAPEPSVGTGPGVRQALQDAGARECSLCEDTFEFLSSRCWCRSCELTAAGLDIVDEQTDPADTAKAGDDLGADWWTARTAAEEDVCDRLADDGTRFRCSRETGHRRQHVATAGRVVVWVWPNPDLLTADEQAAIAEGDPDATWLPDRGWCPPPTQPLLNGRPVSPAIVEWDRLEAVVEAGRALVNWWAGHGMRRPDLDGPTAVLWDAICQLDGVQAGGS